MRTSSVLVPLEAWAYSSPFVRRSGFHVDLGLLADALIYYDHVYIVFSTPEQLAEVLRWFQDSSVLDTFLGMLADDVVTVYRYDFFTGATWANDSWSIWNLQGPRDLDPIDELDRLVLERPQVRNALGSKARIRSFRRAVHDHAVIVESDRFGSAIEESRKDMLDTEPVARAVQALYDEVYRHLRVGEPPEVHVTAVKNGNGKVMLNLGVDLTKLANMLGPRVDLRDSSMIAGFGQVNHLLLSASDLRADLMLPNPLATMASAKLNQGFEHADKLRRIVSELVLRVDFPDVRNLVRSGRLDARTVLKLRSKAGRFRAWLQDEASMDADAVLAYHGEMARESRVSGGTRLLHLFGTIGGSVLAGTIGAAVGSGPVGGAAGGLAGGATQYLVEILRGLNWESLDEDRAARRRMFKDFLDFVEASGNTTCAWSGTGFDDRAIVAGLGRWYPQGLVRWERVRKLDLGAIMKRSLELPGSWSIKDVSRFLGWQGPEEEWDGFQAGLAYEAYRQLGEPFDVEGVKRYNRLDVVQLAFTYRWYATAVESEAAQRRDTANTPRARWSAEGLAALEAQLAQGLSAYEIEVPGYTILQIRRKLVYLKSRSRSAG